MFRKFINGKGQISAIGVIIAIVCVLVVIATIVPMIHSTSVSASVSRLEDQGYVVLSPAEYASLSSRIDNLKTSADAAVVNAVLAASTSEAVLDTLLLHNENVVYLYPENTTYDAVLTSGNGVDTWTANWTEITDTHSTLRESIMANAGGHSYCFLTEMTFREYHSPDIMSIIEIAYGDAHTVVGRVKARSDFTYVFVLRSARIPVGQVIYYRMKSELALEHCTVDFRYYYE